MITPSTLHFARNLLRLQELRQPRDVEVLTLTSGVRVRLHRPPNTGRPAPALIWLHGGGYVLGTARQDDDLCRRFSRALGITVAAVDYRLAPEHPYPLALEDCHQALEWLVRLPAVDPARVAIGGGSAGGGLAAALSLMARDHGDITPVCQVLSYPMLDDRTGSTVDVDQRGQRLWSRSSNRFGWNSYLRDADPRVAVPARRDDLSGLPPTWVGVGTLDLFHDEDVRYAERLRRAGVSCELRVVPGAFHAFDLVAPHASVTHSFFASQCAHLRRAFEQG
ncbi:alpha/beta hydrolase [Mycolicibacterium sp.]|uniref:alpha/beta hydrolase n=1 Tax=Mycolicibacterium sp. TaxID=2320850 RepID=UPI001A231507|nr:alpha/beta hydrolase [Mycolicibacterium sp.]MBJ7337222.1 alpha/beta hydrolase [Mycolicibacterium sp.]